MFLLPVIYEVYVPFSSVSFIADRQVARLSFVLLFICWFAMSARTQAEEGGRSEKDFRHHHRHQHPSPSSSSCLFIVFLAVCSDNHSCFTSTTSEHSNPTSSPIYITTTTTTTTTTSSSHHHLFFMFHRLTTPHHHNRSAIIHHRQQQHRRAYIDRERHLVV